MYPGGSNSTANPLGRAKVAGLHAAGVYDDSLQRHRRVHHPDFQDVRPGLRNRMSGFDFAAIVPDGFLPVAIAVVHEESLGHSGENLRRLVVE